MGVTLTASKRPVKRFKWIKRIAIVIVIYTIVGFLVVPAVIKWQMLKRLPALTRRDAAVKQVRFNPYALSLTIRGFSLTEPGNTNDVFVSFDEFYINFEMWASLFRRSWVFKDFFLAKPFAQAIQKEDGTFNFADLIDTNAPPTPSKPPGPLPSIRIYNFCITNGGLALADLKHKPPFRTELLPIEVNLTNLTTIRNDKSPYSFYARAGSGETFAWAGTVGVTPPRSAGKFRLGGLKLKTYSTYIHDYTRFDIVSGELDVAADYRISITTNGQDLEVSNAAVHLNNLQVKDPDTGEIVASVPQFSVTGAQASLAKEFAWAGLVKTTGGSFLAKRSHDGKINFVSQLNLTPKTTEQISNAVQTVIPWTAGADEISVEDYAIKVEDQMPEKPVKLSVDQINVDVKNVSDKPNAKATVAVSVRYQDLGKISVNGTATFIPISADMQVAMTNVDLSPATPYVSEQVKLLITGGLVDMHGHVRFMGNKPGEPMANFTGDVAVNKFVTTDDVLFKEFAKWDSLTYDGINLSVQPDKLSIDQLKVTGFNGSIIIGPDGRINIQTILRKQLPPATNAVAKTGTNTAKATVKAATPAPKTSSAAAAMAGLPDVKLGALVLENASVHFLDESLEPHCSFDVQEFGGSIKGLSSRDQSNAIVDFKGKVDERSPFRMSGTINPLGTNLFADITVNITNLDLTAFDPYSEKYVGRPLQKGRFSMDAHYFVNGKALKAENSFFIDQLTLGPKNGSTNATKLPVKLAVALLKDRNGLIALPVPVSGRTDDPKFSLGPAMWHVVDTLLVKVATSPFKLLGSMFGGGEEMSFVQFAPGSAMIPSSETNKLETLAKSLYARPALSLEINGSADVTNERVPLGRIKLDEKLKTMFVKELTDSGKPAIAMEQVKLDPKERERLLKKLYKKEIGRYKPSPVSTNLNGGLGNAATLLATMPPPPESDHGASLLLKPKTETVSAAKLKSSSPTVAGKTPTRPLTREELELADMEDQLVERIPVTTDDMRDLMKARAAKVQSYLLQTEKVTADRLFIIAPKTIDKSFKGEPRVNMSLD